MTLRSKLVSALLTFSLLTTEGLCGAPEGHATLPGAPAGRVEAGVPAFVVYGTEAVGLAAPPTDFELLPDGRVLLVNGRELVFGDGVRWELARAADGVPPIYRDVGVGADGGIYYGMEGAIGRVELGTDGRWRALPVYTLPPDPDVRGRTMISVSAVGEHLYWFGTGLILDWQPGETGHLLNNPTAVQVIFRANGRLFVSDVSAGGLYEVQSDGQYRLMPGFEQLPSEAVVCTVPFDGERQVLAGTNFRGLRVFDGEKMTPFGEGVLSGGLRINALCAAGEGRFAAAVDTFGIVFFDRQGRILQTLEASLDHRLARVERLQYSADGVLWALLNQGVARVHFPTPLSRFEALIPSGLSYVHPVRHNGDLWLLADGRALRGAYDAAGKLSGFVRESAPGKFVFTLTSHDGDLLAGTDEGLFRWTGNRWVTVVAGVVNPRLGVARTPAGETVFAARGEIGTLQRRGDGYDVRRIPVPELGDSFNAYPDAHGAWLELGNKRVGRIDSSGARPQIKLYGGESGLKDGWVVGFVLDGEVRFQLPGHILRFDSATEQFVEDTALLARLPMLQGSALRPAQDQRGRVWYSEGGTVYHLELDRPDAKPVAVPLPFPVQECTFQEDGIIWFFGDRRLARYDPKLAPARDTAPQVLITAAKFPNSGRTMHGSAPRLGEIPHADNTVSFNFVSPGNPPSPVWFEVQLAGLTDQWVSTGSVGQAVFNRLKEGRYVFQVRAVRAGGFASAPASVAFEIQPPWFRSPLAWFSYILAGAAALTGAIWYPSVRQRRENARLELLVGRRTEELNATNRELGRQVEETTRKSEALAVSEERYRGLSAQLEQRVQERTAELSLSNLELQQRETLFRLIFEHAPVGISWKRADLDDLHHFNGTYRRILDLKTETHPDFDPLRRLVHPDDTPALRALETRITTGQLDSDRLELRFLRPDGRLVWASICVAVVRDQGRLIQVIGILEDITARKEAEQQLATTYKELLEASRLAGMAEVATGVLHNVGNVLNSLNVSSNLLANNIRQSRTESFVKLAALLREHAADLGDFITRDPKGRLVPELLDKLAQAAMTEREWLLQEIASMQKNIDHIKDIVAMQQSYATVLGVVETLDPSSLFEDALRMNAAALSRHDVRVVREFLPCPLVSVEKGKVLQILTNVIRNAKYACDDGQQYGTPEKVVTVRVEPGADTVRFIVRDTGIGIPPENLTRIFAHGFTTRAYGHGFGLHSSALAAREMKGTLTAISEGLGKGATFVLEVPAAPPGAVIEDRPRSQPPFGAPIEIPAGGGI